MTTRAEVFNANGDSHVYDVFSQLILIVKGDQDYDFVTIVDEGSPTDRGWVDDEDDEGSVSLECPDLSEWDDDRGDEVQFSSLEGKVLKLDIDGDTLMIGSSDDLKPIDKVVVWCSDGDDVEFKMSYQKTKGRITKTKIVVSG